MALCIAYISYELMLVRLMISPEVERLHSKRNVAPARDLPG